MNKIYATYGVYKCTKCGYEFVGQKQHPCPKCETEMFEKWVEIELENRKKSKSNGDK